MHKIEIYSPTNKNFNNAGNATILGTAILKSELNGTWDLAIEAIRDVEEAWKIIEEECVVRVFTFLNKYQLFRVYSVEPGLQTIYISARPIFMDCNDEILLNGVSKNSTAKTHLDDMFKNSKYSATTNISKSAKMEYPMCKPFAAITGDNGFIKTFGGEIIYDGYHIYIYEQLGDDLGLTVELGKNMTGVDITKSTEPMITRLVPVAYNDILLPEKFVDSENINKFAKIYTNTLDCKDLKLQEDCSENETGYATKESLYAEMRKRAKNAFDGKLDAPAFKYDVSFMDLANTDGYEDVKDLITAHLGDTVTVRNKELDLFIRSRVISMEWDCVLGETKSIVIGEYDPTIIDNMVKNNITIDKFSGAIDTNGNVIANQVSGVLNLLTTSLRYQKNAANRLDVRAILMEDIDPKSTLFGAISIGTQGIQISKTRNATNTDWIWGTAMNFEAVDARYIIAGILADRAGKFSLDMVTGQAIMDSLKVTNANVSGKITSSVGKIGGWTISDEGLITEFKRTSPMYTEHDINDVKAYISGDKTLPPERLKYLDVSGRGFLTSLDYVIMRNMINGTVSRTRGYKIIINPNSDVDCISVGIDAQGGNNYEYHDDWDISFTGINRQTLSTMQTNINTLMRQVNELKNS